VLPNCLFVCLLVTRIYQKVINGFEPNSVERHTFTRSGRTSQLDLGIDLDSDLVTFCQYDFSVNCKKCKFLTLHANSMWWDVISTSSTWRNLAFLDIKQNYSESCG